MSGRTVLVAFLRAVNVGDRTVPMARLRELAMDIGLEEPRTLLNSGNLVFATDRDQADLRSELERVLEERFGFHVDVLLRTEEQLRQALERSPFPEAAASDPSHVLVVFLDHPAQQRSVDALAASIEGSERIARKGLDLVVHYPVGIGRSKLTLPRIEKALGRLGTARNLRTIAKLADLARSVDRS